MEKEEEFEVHGGDRETSMGNILNPISQNRFFFHRRQKEEKIKSSEAISDGMGHLSSAHLSPNLDSDSPHVGFYLSLFSSALSGRQRTVTKKSHWRNRLYRVFFSTQKDH